MDVSVEELEIIEEGVTRFVQRKIYQGVWFSYWGLIWSEFKTYEEGGYHKIKSAIVARGPYGECH